MYREEQEFSGTSQVNLYGRVALTDRGQRVLICSLIMGLLGFIFKDVILVCLAVGLWTLMGYTALKMRQTAKNLTTLLILQPNRLEASFNAGETFQETLKISSGLNLPLNFIPPLENCWFEPSQFTTGNSLLNFNFKNVFSGKYSSHILRGEFEDKLGLLKGEGFLPFQIEFRVYPRVSGVAVEAAQFLLASGMVGLWEQPITLKGSGLEYAESRPYVPGDSLRRMDWKATARLGRLVVKDFYMEGSIDVHIVYESRAPDPASLDELSACFLKTVLIFARSGLPLSLTIHDGEQVLYHRSKLPPELAVAQAMKYTLMGKKDVLQILYTVLEPRAGAEIKMLLKELEFSPLQSIWQTKGPFRLGVQNPDRLLKGFLFGEKSIHQFLIISSLMGSIESLLQFTKDTWRKNWPICIIQPTKPWLYSLDLEESHRIWRRYLKLNRILEKAGVNVTTSINEVYKNILSGDSLSKLAL